MRVIDKFIDKKVSEWLGSRKALKVKPGKGRFNQKCHLNATNDALEAREDWISLVIAESGGSHFIHFINVDSNDVYTDNTLGHRSQYYTMYEAKRIHKSDFWRIDGSGGIFANYRSTLRKNLFPWYQRWLVPIDFI